tara:strand:+ start:3119 stop:3658 length:540 start_codon:yes stop_codon:yes gene_type:complete
MNKEIYQSIYQHQIRLARQVNQNLSSLINMDHYSLQLNKLNLFQDIQETLQNIDLSLYTTIPFDTEKYSSYILFHRSFSHELSLLSLGLQHEPELKQQTVKQSLIEEFFCYKISEMIAKYFNSENNQVSVSKEPTSINMDHLSEFSSDLLVSSISLMNQNTPCGNFYIIFPYSLLWSLA